jgi:hypothetical protein
MKLRVWINSFIPNRVFGAVTLTKGPHRGKVAIPLGLLGLAGNLDKTMQTGYLTDQRDFSSDAGQSVRMQSLAELSVESVLRGSPIVEHHRTSGTVEVNTVTGAQTGSGTANLYPGRNTRFDITIVPFPTLKLGLQVRGSASDPCLLIAADIDYTGAFDIYFNTDGTLHVGFSGKVDAFPAFEAYAEFNGQVKELFTYRPAPDATVTNLVGGASKTVAGAVSFP